MQNNVVKVVIWGKEVGSLFWDERRKRSVFSYHPNFVKGDLDIAPLSASIRNPRNKLPLYGMPNDDIYSGWAKRLTALLNGTEYKATVSPKSQRGKAMVADGGTKMDMTHQKKWVEVLLLPKYLSKLSSKSLKR